MKQNIIKEKTYKFALDIVKIQNSKLNILSVIIFIN